MAWSGSLETNEVFNWFLHYFYFFRDYLDKFFKKTNGEENDEAFIKSYIELKKLGGMEKSI